MIEMPAAHSEVCPSTIGCKIAIDSRTENRSDVKENLVTLPNSTATTQIWEGARKRHPGPVRLTVVFMST
jgi:hypothetical protein